MKKFSILIAILLILIIAIPALAIALPDSTPTVEAINVYRNLLETGDRLFVIYANIPYASTPDIPVTEAFVWRLIGTDNVTELGQTTGYAYKNSGYGYNVYSFYFSAADALTWGLVYNIRLSGTPAAFATPPEYNYQVNITDYTSETTQAQNQQDLADRIIILADSLDTHWGLSGTTSLLFQSETGTVLSWEGEGVFRGAIYGCQALAPTAFRLVVTDIIAVDRTWTDNYTANLTGQFAGTWIEPAKTGGGTMFGLGYDLFSIILMAIFCGLIIWANMIFTHDHWNALVDVGILLVAAPHIDLIPLSFTALICALFVIYEGTKVKSFVA